MKWKVFKEEGRSRRAINGIKKRMFLDSDSFFWGGVANEDIPKFPRSAPASLSPG